MHLFTSLERVCFRNNQSEQMKINWTMMRIRRIQPTSRGKERSLNTILDTAAKKKELLKVKKVEPEKRVQGSYILSVLLS